MKFVLDNVTFAYAAKPADRHEVFTHLHLAIESGECVGVVGQEGVGKTTLLQLLNGLVKPESGSVYVDGENVWGTRAGLPQIRRQVGFAFQFPEQHFFCETVEQEMMYAPRNFGLDAAVSLRQALEETGLAPDAYLARSPFTLSTGEARRVALACVLVLQPRAMLLDELTVGLDGEGVERVVSVLDRAKRRGVTLVIVSQDIDVLSELADRIIVLENGIRADESARRLLTDQARLAAFGYDPPEVVRYAGELRLRGVTLPGDVLTVQELRERMRDHQHPKSRETAPRYNTPRP